MSRTFGARRQAWLGQLRTACVVVSEQPPYLIGSISLTQGFAGLSFDERHQLLILATRLAGEYGLKAETMECGSSITVWISRSAPDHCEDAPSQAKQGLVARLLRLLRPRQQTPEKGRVVS